MNTSAIVMMVISMVFLWGGLALSIIHLSKHPEELDDVLEEKWIDFSFPLHIFKEEGSKYEVNLIHNKSKQKVFVPELKQFDYLLVIDGEFDYLPEKMIDQIKRFSQVQLAVEIPVGKLKDRHILVSYK